MTTKVGPPNFSIITITRNNRAGLKDTALSIQNQTNKTYEWIIVDGASTDGTQDDFVNYSSAIIISEPDKGIYDAMNKGIAMAEGNYLIFMNAGDQFASPDMLDKIFPLTLNHPDLIYGDSMEGGHYKTARSPAYMNWGLFTHHQAIFYSRTALGDMRYNAEYKIAADYDLTLRFLKMHGGAEYISEAICVFEQGGISQQQVKCGRDEQFLSRKNIRSCSWIKNWIIKTIQTMAWQIRCHASWLYWFIKA